MVTGRRRKFRAELWNPNTIKRFYDEGRGQKSREFYKPWLTVHDVPSHGFSTRIMSWKYKRLVHLLSRVELYHFYECEWNDNVVDFREQFPLEMSVTKIIADQRKYDHPSAGPNDLPIVMTTDARLTVKDPAGKTNDEVCSIKKDGAWTFRQTDLICPEKFITKLKGHAASHKVSAWLLEKMSDTAKQRIFDCNGTADQRLVRTIVRELNRIIHSGLIYDQNLFAQVFIAQKTFSTMELASTDWEIARVNRMLLKHAYPEELEGPSRRNSLSKRDHQKMQIEKAYWGADASIKWSLKIEADLDVILARNVESIHPYYHLVQYGLAEELKEKVNDLLLSKVLKERNQPLAELAGATDFDLKLPRGTSLTIANHLISRKQFPVDFSFPFEPWLPLKLP